MAFRDTSEAWDLVRAQRRWQQELDRIRRLAQRAPIDPNVPRILGLPNQGGFAANDPRIPASSSGGSAFRQILAKLGRGLGLLGAGSAIAELLIEDKIRQRELDIQSGIEALARKREKLREERGIVREVLVRSDDAGLPAEQIFRGAAAIPQVQLPTAPVPGADVLAGTGQLPQPAIQLPPIEIPDPGTFTPEIPAPEPVSPGVEAPAPSTRPAPAPIPVPLPSTVTTPGFGIPVTPTPFPTPAPVGFPVFPPVRFPIRQPVGDPFGLTPIQPGALPSPGPRGFQPGVLELPQPQPLPQPATRRCRPCPGEEPPKPREACYKGLYREGLFDNDVDFTEWAEIDCITGVEL